MSVTPLIDKISIQKFDAQTISTIIGTDSDVQYVNDNVFKNKNGYQDLKALVHRHIEVQEINNHIGR